MKCTPKKPKPTSTDPNIDGFRDACATLQATHQRLLEALNSIVPDRSGVVSTITQEDLEVVMGKTAEQLKAIVTLLRRCSAWASTCP